MDPEIWVLADHHPIGAAGRVGHNWLVVVTSLPRKRSNHDLNQELLSAAVLPPCLGLGRSCSSCVSSDSAFASLLAIEPASSTYILAFMVGH